VKCSWRIQSGIVATHFLGGYIIRHCCPPLLGKVAGCLTSYLHSPPFLVRRNAFVNRLGVFVRRRVSKVIGVTAHAQVRTQVVQLVSVPMVRVHSKRRVHYPLVQELLVVSASPANHITVWGGIQRKSLSKSKTSSSTGAQPPFFKGRYFMLEKLFNDFCDERRYLRTYGMSHR